MATHPFVQLDVLKKVALSKKVVKDCYRLMYQPLLWEVAYKRLKGYRVQSDVSKRVKEQIQEQINTLKNGGVPFLNTSCFSFKERWIHEVMNDILKVVLFPKKQKTDTLFPSHCALNELKRKGENIRSYAIGSFTHLFTSKVQKELLQKLTKKINDVRFLNLILHSLQKGLLNNWAYTTWEKEEKRETLSFTLSSFYFLTADQQIKKVCQSYGKMSYLRYKNIIFCGFSTMICHQKQELLFRFKQSFPTLCVTFSSCTHSFLFLHYKCFWNKKKKIVLHLSQKRMVSYSKKYHYGSFHPFLSKHRKALLHKKEEDIVRVYNQELYRIAFYFSLAQNYTYLEKLFYLAESSFIKTLACKRKTTSKKMIRHLKKDAKDACLYVPILKKNQKIGFLRLKHLPKSKPFLSLKKAQPYLF